MLRPAPVNKTSLQDGGRRLMQYAGVAAGGLGITNGKALRGPLNVQIGISDPCNHRCVMCWDHPPDDRENESTMPLARFGREKPGMMSLELFESIIDDLHALGTRRVDLVGRGEPLMNKSALEMASYAKHRGFEMQMISNGALLTEERANHLVGIGLDVFKVSLNAGTPETYPTIHVTETPENYLRVKRNLRYLADRKVAMGVAIPHIQLSFCIGARNYHEIDQMIEVAGEVGAQEVLFSHTVVHDDTQDLTMGPQDVQKLKESIPAIHQRADELGLQHNLAGFGASIPGYMDEQMVGPAVVPCYAGWYFALILGNGSVLFCCQCSQPIDRVTPERRFIDIWNSHVYQQTRKAARALPEKSSLLATCECDQCALRPRNISIHNFLHPLKQIDCGNEVRRYSLYDISRKWKGQYA